MAVKGWVPDMTDDGSGSIEGIEWDSDSACLCQECHHYATVADFDEKLCEVKDESEG